MSIPASAGPFERWVTKLRVSWMGDKAKAIFGGWAAAMADKTRMWAIQVLYEHLPEYASNDSLPLIGSGRGLPQGRSETFSAFATRLTQAIPQWRRAGSPLGLLYALHVAGFDGAVLVQQNGVGYSLSTPVNETSPVMVTTTLSALDVALHSDHDLSRSIPAVTPWWTFDSDTDFCSRFAILFPDTLPGAFVTYGVATFTGAEDGSTTPWPTVTWNNPFPDMTYVAIPGAVYSTSPAAVSVDPSTKTKTTVQVAASGPFVGTVEVLAWQTGSNPFADLHPADLARLQTIVRAWKPSKATCRGVYALVLGHFIGWPVRLIGAATPGPASIVSYTEGF